MFVFEERLVVLEHLLWILVFRRNLKAVVKNGNRFDGQQLEMTE